MTRKKRDIVDTLLEVTTGEPTEEEYFCDLQRLINSGTWGMEGSMGRAMMEAIEGGACCLGREPAHDYWGNRVPSRSEVVEGTKGSVQYVRNIRGEEWAKMIEEVE